MGNTRAHGALLIAALTALCSCSSGGSGSGNGGAGPGVGEASGDPGGLVSQGDYQCYTFSGGELMAALGENFSITGPGTYADVGGAGGQYTYDSAAAVLTFSGAALDGQRAKYDPTVTPITITFIDAQGNLFDSCDHQ